MCKIVARLLPLLLLVCFHTSASAQQPDRPPNLNLGDAVVTGFSGILAPDASQPRTANKSATDLTFIDPDGPSARIIGLGQPGYVWDGRLFQAPKTFDVFAKDVGQVFGVALDDASPPNIYLAATSAFGLNIVGRGRDGLPERRKKGGPGSGWMKGQFGLELQGGPGSIYKVDGRTGAVSLFANVTLDGVPNPGPGLGNLAYDSAHKQLFVSDLYTGMIHRFALDGRDLGAPYDHGVTGRPAQGNVPAQAFNPQIRLNIANARFNSEDPDTWGLAPPARRVWALAVHEGRLYYSARNGAPANGPQIWSVGIQQDGNFAADARWELNVADQPESYAVSDIAFSEKGAMILAQRAPSAGAYDFNAFTQPGEPRVLRYWLEQPDNPNTPSRWIAMPEEYAVGFAGSYRNSNGGVALGYGYDQDGRLQPGSCEAALWSTGQNLRNNPALRSQLDPGGPLLVHGLQGSPADLVRNGNEPPATSYFIDYDDKFDDARASGHMGSVRILTQPCAAPVAVIASPVVSPIAIVPVGCVGPNCGEVCKPTCVCPNGGVLKDGKCEEVCPPPMVVNPTTGVCGCPHGTVLVGKECVPVTPIIITCPPPFVPGPTPGSCVCPPGTIYQGGTCVPVTTTCPPPMIPGATPGSCICPPGTVQQGRICVPQVCPPPLVPGPCECPRGEVLVNGLCVQAGILIVKKTVTSKTDIPLPANTLFPMTVTCGLPTMTWSFSLPANGTYTINNIPFGMTCSVVETLPPLPANLCRKPLVPVWLPLPTYTPPSVVIGGTVSTIVVHNSVTCEERPDGRLTVTKKVSPDPRGIGNTLTFPMVVTCTNPSASYPLSVNGNTSILPFNVPVGSSCFVTETLPALPAGCSWLAPVFSPASVTIANGLNIETVTNGYRCRELCPPPQVMIPGVGCRCPPPMVTGATPDTCVCPTGTVLVNGTCVKVDVCPPGTVRKGRECICPQGTVQKGRECVKVEIVCISPLVRNAAGTACVRKQVEKKKTRDVRECPKGQVMVRGKCREPEQRSRDIERLPQIRIPGGFGGGGRGGGSSPQGGGGQGGPGRR